MTTPTVDPLTRYRQLVAGLLDQGYDEVVTPVLRAINRNGTSGLMAQRYRELEAEAQRLAAAGERLQPDNPILRAVLADLETALARDAAVIDGMAAEVQATGSEAAGTVVRQLALPGFDDNALRVIGVEWVVPDPEAVAQVVNYTGNPLWQSKLGNYRDGILAVARNQAIRGVIEGWGPVRTARAVRQAGVDLPVSAANTMMRTLQLTGYREASVVHRLANAAILTAQIRIATLDDRTCLACIALHGTRLPINARIDDHHNGRCDSISVVVNRPREIESGESWLNRQSPERQRAIMGGANYNAWRAGAVELRQFVRPYEDDLFGRMIQEQSLVGVLGPQAQQYYQN